MDRIAGLDYGRALAALFVLLWHEHFFGVGSMFSQTASSPHLPGPADILNANILLQAVPFFIFLSCYLYVARESGMPALKRRAARVTTLHVFWGIAYFVVLGGIPALISAAATFQTRPVYATVTAMGSYYFFSALLVTVVLTHIAARLRSSWLIALTLVSFAAITGMQAATIKYGIAWTSAFWNPLNYVAIPPLAILLVRHLEGQGPTLKTISLLAAAFVLVAAAEWALLVDPVFARNQGYAMPAYTRISPALFSCLAICILLRVRRAPGAVISFMAKYALAVYCLQAFVLTWTADLKIPLVLKTAIDLGACYLLAFLLHRFVFKDQLLASGHRA
ncbi:acyltransferase family protein [Achromobacter sp. NPDC058515]|uniref:acyltransferase family protein n=1 Tax=Achromobacter sp. NPDC058515 TaxID=3346533 RepID=UPI00365B40C1